MSARDVSRAVTPRRPITGRTAGRIGRTAGRIGRTAGRIGRLCALLTVMAVLAAACGSEDATEVATQAPAAVPATPTAIATKEPVAPPASASEVAEPPVATTEEVTEAPVSEPAPPVEPPAPVGDLADLPSLSSAIVAAIGRSDVSTALGEIGPFPADIPFPDDAVLVEITMGETDSRILLGDPEVIRPINTTTGGVAATRLKIGEAQDFYLDPLAAAGYELTSSGFSTTTQGDGTEVRGGFFAGGDTSVESPLRESLSLTLVSRPDTDFVEIELSYSTDHEPDVASPVTSWVAGLPVPDGYQMHSARVSTFYFGSPALSFNASFSGPEGQIDQAVEQMMGLLPAGGWELGTDTTVGGDEELRYFDLVYPEVGDGEVAVSEGSDDTAIRPTIDVEFPLPASLEPFLLQ